MVKGGGGGDGDLHKFGKFRRQERQNTGKTAPAMFSLYLRVILDTEYLHVIS